MVHRVVNIENKKELKVYMLGEFQVTGMDGELGIEHKCPKRIILFLIPNFSYKPKHTS